MVNQPIIISTVATTKYVIAVLYYNSDPLVEISRVVKAPGDDTTNYMFIGVDPGAATVRYYESDNDTDLTTLLGTFQINISEEIRVFEERWYTVGGTQVDIEGNLVDPIPGERSFTDIYLDGKEVTSLTRRGMGQIQKDVEWSRTGNTITLLNPENQLPDGPIFEADDKWLALLTFLQDVVVQVPKDRVYFDEITEDITLTSSNRNKWNYINGSNARLTIIAEDIAMMGNGEWYGFVTNGGNQHQVLFKAQTGQAININGEDKSFVVFGKMERWKIFKRDTKLEILEGLDYLHGICRFFKSHKRSEINGLWCDGEIYSGDDYPRPFYEIKNMLDSINSSTVTVNREAAFYWWESGGNKFFRTPNKQNVLGGNLKDFDALGTDPDRLSDYPGGKKPGRVGKHRHLVVVPSGVNSDTFPQDRTPDSSPQAGNSIREYWQKGSSGKESYVIDCSTSEPSACRTSETGENIAGEGYPTTYGEFEFIKI